MFVIGPMGIFRIVGGCCLGKGLSKFKAPFGESDALNLLGVSRE